MMKLTPDNHNAAYTIRACHENEIIINDTSYQQTLLLSAEKLQLENLPQSITEISQAHIQQILTFNPTIVIIGSGQRYQPLDVTFSQQLLTQGIGLEVMTTAAACRTFNVLLSEGRNAVALLFIE